MSRTTRKAPAKPRSHAYRHTIRSADEGLVSVKLTRKLAMACFCTECLGWEDVPGSCTARLCPMYPFRAKTLRTMKANVEDTT